MKKPFFFALLFSVCATAQGQFNTIKKIRTLPKIQIDTAIVRSEAKSFIEGFEPSNPEEVNEVSEKITSLVSMPLSHPIINSTYGNRTDPLTGEVKFHQGIDFKGYADSVLVVMPGKVRKVAYSRGLGNYVEVEHGDYRSIYGHLSYALVREKEQVTAGTVLGITGTTGRSTGEHLHFAVKYRGKLIDPTPVLDLIYRSVEMKSRNRTVSVGGR